MAQGFRGKKQRASEICSALCSRRGFFATSNLLRRGYGQGVQPFRYWTAAGTLTILGYLLGRYRIWAGIIAFVLAALMAWAQIGELIDPYVGPAIAAEAGRSYFVQSYLASALALIAPIAGVIQRRIRDSRQFRC